MQVQLVMAAAAPPALDDLECLTVEWMPATAQKDRPGWPGVFE